MLIQSASQNLAGDADGICKFLGRVVRGWLIATPMPTGILMRVPALNTAMLGVELHTMRMADALTDANTHAATGPVRLNADLRLSQDDPLYHSRVYVPALAVTAKWQSVVDGFRAGECCGNRRACRWRPPAIFVMVLTAIEVALALVALMVAPFDLI